jgi:hypothetical protein
VADLKLIAHRGLLEGPNGDLENNPEQITRSRSLGYDSEIDLWRIQGALWLGHDSPRYQINEQFLYTIHAWIHAKNIDALYWLTTTNNSLKYFWHQGDDCTLTSNNYIWTYPEKPLNERSIRLMPEWHDPEFKTVKDNVCYAICTDHVLRIQNLLNG